MASSLFQNQNNSQPQMINNIKQMANMMNNSGNPMQMLQTMAQSNPQLGNMLSMMQSSGLSPKEFFMQQAQQMGVNPNDIIGMLK